MTGLSCGECKRREWSSGEGVWWGTVVVSVSGGVTCEWWSGRGSESGVVGWNSGCE